MPTFNAIGIMSGTSLDGLDFAYCSFDENRPGGFEIICAQTVEYSAHWKKRLAEAPELSGVELVQLSVEFSKLTATEVTNFLRQNDLKPPSILSAHGHTVFHQPELGFTYQLGCGPTLAATSGIDTVFDFRTGNVALGGQGAPLVPIGDLHLFNDFDACLNLGGFGNISRHTDGNVIAFDICPVNMAMNEMAEKLQHPYDKDGALARSGQVNEHLLQQLNTLPFYQLPPPKSLGREWYLSAFLPLLNAAPCTPQDKLATLCEHVAQQVACALSSAPVKKVLVTGGGAHNSFLIERIRKRVSSEIILPASELIDFKEALVFAYMGWLRWRGIPNCLSTYTGGAHNLCSGSIHRAPDNGLNRNKM